MSLTNSIEIAPPILMETKEEPQVPEVPEIIPEVITAPPVAHVANRTPTDPALVTKFGGRRQTKKKRKRVGRACVFCQRSHMSCDDARPCRRCVARGCADQCRDPDGKRKRRGRKKKTAAPEDDDGSTSDSGDEDLTSELTTSGPMPIVNPHNHMLGRSKRDSVTDDLHDQFAQSLESMSHGSRPFFVTKAKRRKTKDFSDESDDSDQDGINLAGPTNHFGFHGGDGHHHHPAFDEDDQISALNTTTTPMAVPRGSQARPSGNHDEFAQFNIYPDLLTLPSPVSTSQSHAHLWFPSPRSSIQMNVGSHAFEVGDPHFVASPVISGLAASFGANSCGSSSYLHTPTGAKGFHDFYSGGNNTNDSHVFDGFTL